ncbi:MAG TPA: BTAD domain-containing putative transcriptional regulator [Mycobacteriales bacterium]
MEFLLLGPVEVRDARRRVPAGGPQAEKALALLLLAAGRAVPVEELVEALWDGRPPRTATHQVHKIVGGLRGRFPGLIVTDGRAYRLRLGPHTLDVDRFSALTERPEIPGLVAALALWRGPALAGLDGRALRAAAAALDDRRRALLARLAAAGTGLGSTVDPGWAG